MKAMISLILMGIFICTAAFPQENPIRVGAFVSLTGPHKVYGVELQRGLELALEEINAGGGVRGRSLELIIRDDQSNPGVAIKNALDLIRKEQVMAIIGGAVSELALAGAQACQREHRVMLAPFATNPAITATGDFIFRISFDDRFQADIMARFAYNELKINKVVILKNVSNPYSSDLARFFEEQYISLGGKVLKVIEYDANTVQFQDLLQSLPQIKDLFAIYLPGYDIDTARIVKTLRKLNIDVTLLGADTWDSRELLKLAGTDFHKGYYTTLYDASIPNKLNQNFVARFREKYNVPPTPDAVAAYDALQVLTQALRSAEGALNPVALKEALKKVKYEGPSGRIIFDAQGNTRRDAVIMQIKDGQRSLYKLYGSRS